jgi:hypothetical protein
MAISNLRLNVTANTARALADFNKFSRSLDNKFLISGLKLDVVRNALSQINKDFQRAIGEQGLASASSLRAAQNQAALLTQTFKGFASESALSITQNIGTALNNVAVRAGGTMKDVQKTLAATPFIDINLSEDLRNKLAKGILSFQRDMRRAGLGENFGGLAQQFLMGQATGMQMLNSGDAMQSFLGSQIIKRVGGEGMLYSPEERTRVLSDILNDPEIIKQLSEMAKRAAGFRIILEDLNTKLFNTESGVFGSLRKVIDRTGKSTTMFDEVYKLVDQVFGPNGMFRAIFSSIQEIFGIGNPMRPFIDAIQFVTSIFNDLTAYFESSGFKDILVMVRETFGRVGELFKGIYDQIRGGTFDSENITRVIGEIGSSVREYIVNISKAIRGEDLTQESGFVSDIAGSLFEEVGKTTVVLIKELFAILLDKVPEIASQVLPAINKGINGILTEAFGEVGAKIVKFIAGFLPGPIGMVARASAVGDVTGGGGSIGSMLAMGAGALAGPAALFGAARLGRGLFGGDQARMGLLGSLTQRTNRVEELYNSRMRQLYMPGAQRVPLSGLLGRVLGPRTPFASPVSFPPPGGGSTRRSPGGALDIGGPGIRFLSALSSIRRPRGFMSRLRGDDLPFEDLYDTDLRVRGRTMYSGVGIGPQPDTVNNPAPGMSSLDPRFPWAASGQGRQPYMESRMLTPNEIFEMESFERDARWRREERSRGDVRRRFIQSQGGGLRGRRALLGAQMRRMGSGFRGVKGFGKGALITGALAGAGALILGGPGAKAQTTQFDPATGQMVPVAGGGGGGIDFSSAGSVLGGGFEGAMTGAAIGSIIPGIGTAAGAVIGGIIGGIAPLMDEGVKKSFKKMLSDIGSKLSSIVEWFGKGTEENFGKFTNFLGNTLKGIANALIFTINASITAFTMIPRLIITTVENLFNRLPEALKPDWAKGAIGGIKSIAGFQLPYFAEGKDYIGGTMALEARLSGNRPMVVNDGEFVIPRDGFPILAGLVGENLRTTGVINNGGNQPIQINVSLSVTANSVVADANELATVLREPVYKIVGDAWDEAVNATRVHRARVN